MRQWILVGALAGALVTTRAGAQGASSQPVEKTSDPHPAEQERGKDIKGYGYGEQPGKSGTAAKQETGPDRQKSTAPQDERRSSAGARTEGSATGQGARSVAGRVVKVSKTSLSLRSDDRRVHRLHLDGRTRVLREGTEVSVGTLAAGEEVRAAFETRGGRRVATTITLVEQGAREPASHTDQARESERRQGGGAEPGLEAERSTPPIAAVCPPRARRHLRAAPARRAPRAAAGSRHRECATRTVPQPCQVKRRP